MKIDISKPKKLVKQMITLLKDFKARWFLKNYKHYKSEKIKVAFIVQMPEIWDKLEPVYDEMSNRSEFDCSLVVVPSFNVQLGCLNDFGYEYDYFSKKYEGKKLHKYNSIKMGEERFNYVFLQRPYDSYLPEELRSYSLMKYSRVCYIPYGQTPSNNFNDLNTNKDFFRNVYFSFSDAPEIAETLRRKFSYNSKNGIQKFEFLGYPSFEKWLISEKLGNKKHYVVTWTPRWSIDDVIGGSTFFEYKDVIIKLGQNKKVKLVFRPHPLMFDSFIEKGLMKKQEVDEYINVLSKNGVTIDIKSNISSVLSKTDILITDISSIIAEFYLTGRPIIFIGNDSVKLKDTFEKMIIFSYSAHDFEELRSQLSQLIDGIDQKYEERKKNISEFKEVHNKASQRIAEAIAKDFNGK